MKGNDLVSLFDFDDIVLLAIARRALARMQICL
jgi:hypothetical protein